MARICAAMVIFATVLALLLASAGTLGAAPAPPYPIVLIVMENKTYDAIINDPTDANYIDNTLIPAGTLFTNYYADAPGSRTTTPR